MEGLKTKEDRRFQTFWVIFFILISVIAIIPVLRVISISFSGRDAINKGQVFIFPIGFNVDAYAKALKSGTTQLVAENIKAASITLSMTPMLVVYPFIQRFFTQGIMLGAVKG